jgi:hypothetical protein
MGSPFCPLDATYLDADMKWFEKNVIAPLDNFIFKIEKFWDRGAVQKIAVLFGFFFFSVIFLSIATKVLM